MDERRDHALGLMDEKSVRLKDELKYVEAVKRILEENESKTLRMLVEALRAGRPEREQESTAPQGKPARKQWLYRKGEMADALLKAARTRGLASDFDLQEAYSMMEEEAFEFRGPDKAWDLRALTRVIKRLVEKRVLKVKRPKSGSHPARYSRF